MKVWYSKKLEMYVPTKDWWEEKPDDLVQLDVKQEVIECEGGSDEPYLHAGVWEQEFYDENWMHCLGTRIPWKKGKYRIIIEEVKE